MVTITGIIAGTGNQAAHLPRSNRQTGNQAAHLLRNSRQTSSQKGPQVRIRRQTICLTKAHPVRTRVQKICPKVRVLNPSNQLQHQVERIIWIQTTINRSVKRFFGFETAIIIQHVFFIPLKFFSILSFK